MGERRRLTMAHKRAGGELPPGYTAVSSLSNPTRSGGAYLDTGLIAKGTLKVRIRFKLNGDVGYIFGGRVSNSSRGFTFTTGGSGNWNDAYGGTYDTGVPYDYNEHELIKDRGKTYIDGVRITNRANDSFSSDRRLLIFASDNNGTVSNPTLMTLYELQIWDNDVLVRDYRLATDPNGRSCVYDVVNDTTTYSAGGIDFTYER